VRGRYRLRGSTGTLTVQYTGSALKDLAGNAAPASNAVSVAIDKAAPRHLDRPWVQTATNNLATVTFAVTLSEAVTALRASDFSASLNGATVQSVVGSGTSYTVTINTGLERRHARARPGLAQPGRLRRRRQQALAAIGSNASYTIDKTAPPRRSRRRCAGRPRPPQSTVHAGVLRGGHGQPWAADFEITGGSFAGYSGRRP
jgi:hypothetical protein